MAKEKKSIGGVSFAGRVLTTREGMLDTMLAEGKSIQELEKFYLKSYGSAWAKTKIQQYIKGLEKSDHIKLETIISINSKKK